MITTSTGKRSKGMSYPTLWVKKDGKITCTDSTGNPKRILRGRHS